MIKKTSLIILIISIYFIVRTYGIAEIIPGYWVIPLLIITIYSFYSLQKQNPNVVFFLVKESRWILLSLVILSIYIGFDYGNFKLTTTFIYLLVSLPFYILGFLNGVKSNESFIRKISIFYFMFLGIYLLPKTFLVLSLRNFNPELFISLFIEGGVESSFIFFLPFTGFVSIFGYALMSESKSVIIRLIALMTLIAIIIALFIASKAGPIAMLILTFIIYNYYKKGKKTKLSKFFILIIVSVFAFIFVFSLAKGVFGNLGSLQGKSTALIDVIDSGILINDAVLDGISSNRWSAIVYSFRQFLAKPLFGHGAYLEEIEGMLGNVDLYTTAAGGHSFFFDTIAYYGIFGFSIILILFKFCKDGFKYYKIIPKDTLESKKALFYSSLISSVFIINILNTGFLFSSFDNYLFLISGFYLGKTYSKKIKLI